LITSFGWADRRPPRPEGRPDRKPTASTTLYRSGNTTRTREVAGHTRPNPDLAGRNTR
jgi:hypothetical protein